MTVKSLPFAVHRPRSDTMRRFRRACIAVASAYDRWLQRQALAELDDRLLDDIGLTRRDVERECAKIVWSTKA
ncbi:DUF1127 domain-containing protein [Mesorhizobium xinjiangense]|uniref:DUF1127 domain-containing protein n=1 Tax=Mesorhizobium xinjiangense TaxID=2678685 RepID=UPI001F233894|nr:DUF1127 domain-containing protein [Mesorhizobium xinjiangense]